jgi:hypothetical protein
MNFILLFCFFFGEVFKIAKLNSPLSHPASPALRFCAITSDPSGLSIHEQFAHHPSQRVSTTPSHMSKQITTDNTAASTTTTNTAPADRVVLATPDLHKLKHRLNSTVYGDGDDELVEALEKCLKGKASNARSKTTISILASVFNDCGQDWRSERRKVKFIGWGDLPFVWLWEYRDYIIKHSDCKNITSFNSF